MRSLSRMGARGGDCSFLEQDTEDMFWNIPKDEVFRAVRWACSMVRKRPKTLYFSIAKAGLKQLDKLAKASLKILFLFSKMELNRYVTFDVRLNNLFTL